MHLRCRSDLYRIGARVVPLNLMFSFEQNFVFRIILARSSIEFDVSNSHFAASNLGKSSAKVKIIISRVNLVLQE